MQLVAAALALGGSSVISSEEAMPRAGAPGAAGGAEKSAATISLEVDGIASDMRFLAHPALRGREAGTLSAEWTALYLAQRFERLGLIPIARQGAEKSFRQAVPLRRITFDRVGASFAGTSATGARVLELHGNEIALELKGPTPPGLDGPLEVTFAGYGIVAEGPPRHDDLAGLDVRGRAVVVWDGEPKLADGQSPFTKGRLSRHALVATKVELLGRAGASLVIVIPKPDGPAPREAFERERRERTRPLLVPRAATPAPPVIYADAALAAALLRAAEIEPRGEPRAAGERVSASWPRLRVRLTLPGATEQEIVEHNVLGLLPGRDPVLSREWILVGAHHDHLGFDEVAGGPPIVYPGADDNASGVAGVLALAQALSSGERPARSVLFALFAAEEKGALGSRFLAGHPLPIGQRLVAVVNLDMISRNNLDRESNGNVAMASYTAQAEALGPLLAASAAAIGLDLRKLPSLRPVGRSDDSSFAEREIPSVMFFTGSHKDYNMPSDTADNASAAKAAKVASVALDFVRRLAREQVAPTWDATLRDPPPSDPWDRPY